MSEIQLQIERRQQRALEEIVRITNRGSHPLFSPFDVVSISGRTYRVTIRALDERRNSCTCPDYRTNFVGTCKHIEGVLLHLKREYADRLQKLAAQKPTAAQIFLHYAEAITVRVTLPLPRAAHAQELLARYFDADGVLQGAAIQTLPALLAEINALPARERSQIVVDDAVREHLELTQDRESVRKQKDWFREQVAQGNRSLSLLNTRLYPYQEQGALHLAFGGRTLLADDMGLGKTIQAIAASALLQQLRDIHKVLIITPASLKYQWAREIRRFTALSATVVQGGLKQRRDSYAGDSFFTILNYELVRRDLDELERVRPDVIILDEAQRIKNWRTKTADAVKRLRSRYAFVLTGTPLENRLDELYSVFQFLDPRILGPLWHFNDRFYDLEQRDDGSYKVLGYKNLDEMRHTIAPYVVRRTRDEVLRDLPPRVDNNFFVEMTPPQIAAYNEFKETVAKLLATARRRPLTPKEHDLLLKALIKMRLICNALALHDKEIKPADREKTAPKLRELHHILDEQIASNGHKAIVFSQWEAMLDFVKPILDRLNLGHVKLAGSVPTSKRGEIVDRFLNERDCRVFLSTDAGGVGLNLQAADLVINLDLPWNPAVLEQRIGRAHRHGQLNPVHVVNLIAQGTIEERMLDTLAAKRNVFGSVFGNEDSPTAISFRDSGQGLLRRLDEMLGAEIKPVIELAPVQPPSVSAEEVAPRPTLHAFAELLVARFPGRVLLVRKAPIGDGVFVVVDREPAELRNKLEALASEYFIEATPALHLMEQEGYRTFIALAGKIAESATPEDEAFRAPVLPAPDRRAGMDMRLQKARTGFDFAFKRAQLAEVVLRGGFPEETLRPLRDAFGWALSSHHALVSDRDPSAEFPSARVIQAELVEPGHLLAELAARCAQARELTEPPTSDDAPPLSAKSAEQLLATAREVIEAGQKRVVEKGL
ncbi:MAG: DEAD/DEAH box helicase [Chloroflexi bacterium]|nr:DEAD/DEAH box helicase [Chloroflexota bacterium]